MAFVLARSACSFVDCSYTAGAETSCSPGGNDCTAAFLQTAYRSAFHDDPLREATEEINDRWYKLSRKPPSPGLQLSFLLTDRGVFLAWTRHLDEPPAEGVTRADGAAANIEALGLYPHPYHSDPEGFFEVEDESSQAE